MSERPPSLNRCRGAERAIAAVAARADDRREVDRRRITTVLARCGLSADVGALCRSAIARGQIVLNFHPDRLLSDGRSVAEALRDEGRYRSQYETGISNGGLTAYPGGDRDEWERRLFADAYHHGACTASARPKYGALNLAGMVNGPAPAFGSCALVLGGDVAQRTTFLFGDSSERCDDLGTADAFEPVLAALLERVHASGQMLGLGGVSVDELVQRLETGARPPAFSRALDDYIESHTHGTIELRSDAVALLLDPSYRAGPTGHALQHAAERHALDVIWHPGSVLTLADFPTTTPIPKGHEPTRWQQFLLDGRARRLAERVIAAHASGGIQLSAAAIGSAAQAFRREPAEWREWGAPDPSITALKDLWRILAAHGSSAEPMP